MKYLKVLLIACLVFTVTACSNKTANLEAFYKQVDIANKDENKIVKASEDLEKLENEKLQLFNKVNKAKTDEMKKLADQLIKNTSERKAIADKETKAMDESKTKFEASKKNAKSVEDKEQKKQVDALVGALDDKYAKHDALMKAYNEILSKEKDLFNYLKTDNMDKATVNEKIAAVTKLYEQFQKKTDDYNKTTRDVETAKKPIVKTLNEA